MELEGIVSKRTGCALPQRTIKDVAQVEEPGERCGAPEEREIHQYDLADQLLFAVDREAKRRPETNRIHFPSLFGKTRDRCHALMVRRASQLIWQVAKECRASPREIEAALFMWGYNVAGEPDDWPVV